MNEAFSNRYATGLCIDSNHLGNVDFAYASKCIADLKAAKERGWTAIVVDTSERDNAVAKRVTEIKARRASGLPYHKNEKGEWI